MSTDRQWTTRVVHDSSPEGFLLLGSYKVCVWVLRYFWVSRPGSTGVRESGVSRLHVPLTEHSAMNPRRLQSSLVTMAESYVFRDSIPESIHNRVNQSGLGILLACDTRIKCLHLYWRDLQFIERVRVCWWFDVSDLGLVQTTEVSDLERSKEPEKTGVFDILNIRFKILFSLLFLQDSSEFTEFRFYICVTTYVKVVMTRVSTNSVGSREGFTVEKIPL